MSFKNSTAAVNAVRYAVKARGTWATFVKDNGITLDTVSETSKALASLAFPSEEPRQTVPKTDDNGKPVLHPKTGKAVQVRTTYGNAVQAAAAGMRSVLVKDETDDETVKALLTAAGKAATLEAVTAAWHASQK